MDTPNRPSPDPISLEYARMVPRRWNSRWREPARGPVRELLAVAGSGVAYTVIAWLLVAVPLGVVFYFTGPVLGFPGLVVLVLFVALLAAAARAVRRRRANVVLGYLDQAVRLNQPLDRLLAVAALSEAGVLRQRLENLALAMREGLPLADGLLAAVPEVSPRAVAVIDHGESAGRLGPALNRLLRDELRAERQAGADRVYAAWYPPIMLMVAAIVVGMIGVFVLPKFVWIFHSFHLSLPWLTLWLWGLFNSDTAVNVAIIGMVVLAVAILAAVGTGWRQVLHGERRSWVLRAPRDRLAWLLPIVGPPHRDRNWADVCHALADSVEQGYPLGEAVARAQRLDLNGVAVRRLGRWAGELAAGADPATAARAAGLPGLVVGVLATTAGPGLGPGLRFAGRFFAGRSTARREVLLAAYVPAVTVALGLLVAVIALSLIAPMCLLIDSLSGPSVRGGL